uniref:Ataxin-2 C-terminal domain-containing protein n=1 Tax=Ciona savignyi TaxID=51511 RepID=H2ZK10_CIOSA
MHLLPTNLNQYGRREPEVTSSTRENNWANFDQFDSLQVQKENSKDDDLKTSTTDSAVEPKETKVETMVLSEEPDISPEKLVEMEIAAAEAFAAPSSPSDPSSSTPPTDVAMEVQEDAKSSDAEEKPNVSGNTASQVSPMETDDMPTSSIPEPSTSAQSTQQESRTNEDETQQEEDKDEATKLEDSTSARLPDEVSSTSDAGAIETSDIAVEIPLVQVQNEDSDVIAIVTSTDALESDTATPSHATSSGDQLSSEVELSPLKSDGDVQNNEVTSSTVDSAITVNGPV